MTDRPATNPFDSGRCPKCGWAVGAAAECPRCGVVLAKARAAPAVADDLAAHQFEARPVKSRAPMLLLLLVFAVVAAYAVSQVGGAGDLEEVDAVASTRPGSPSSVGTSARPQRRPSPPRAAAPQPVPTFDENLYAAAPGGSEGDSAGAEPRYATYSYDWYEDAAGLQSALEEAERDGRAVAVYFRTDWCGYCRQLESELLTHGAVEDYMKYLVKVRINPDHGPSEQQLAKRYGVRGYPSLFVHASPTERPTKISRTRGGRLKTAQEFVDTLRRAAEG